MRARIGLCLVPAEEVRSSLNPFPAEYAHRDKHGQAQSLKSMSAKEGAIQCTVRYVIVNAVLCFNSWLLYSQSSFMNIPSSLYHVPIPCH